MDIDDQQQAQQPSESGGGGGGGGGVGGGGGGGSGGDGGIGSDGGGGGGGGVGGGSGGGGNGSNSADIGDIEQSFLQQFSCLGTTDHDELVNQLQKVLGNQLNYTTARFFLDMNNWNLQAAVGCYFDFYSANKTLPSMKFLSDYTIGEGESVTPNTRFYHAWRVQNDGEEAWPFGCYLKLTTVSDGTCVHVPSLRPGEICVLKAPLISPSELGFFQTKWRLCTRSGSFFGDTMWSIVQVDEAGTLQKTQLDAEQQAPGIVSETAGPFQEPQPPPSSPQQHEDNEMC